MEKNNQSKKMFMILLIVASISTLYFVIPAVSDAAEEPKTFLTHTGLAIQTTGDITVSYTHLTLPTNREV